jgi:hypothetical protein
MIPRGLKLIEDPLQGIPIEQRRAVIRKIGDEAKTKYDKLTAELGEHLRPIEPKHTVCCSVYLLAFTGDKPYSEKDFSFGQHEAELLQAFLLRHPIEFYEKFIGTPDQVQRVLDITKEISAARLRTPYAEVPDDNEEFARRSIIEEIRLHTQLIRGDFYPEQLKRLFRQFLVRLEPDFKKVHQISPAVIFDLLMRLTLLLEDRLNDHVQKVAKFYSAKTLEKVVDAYKAAFPSVNVSIEDLRSLSPGKKDKEILGQAKVALLAHSDLRIRDIFEATTEGVSRELHAIDPDADLPSALAVLDQLSLSFGELSEKPIDHVIMDNPVWCRPLIKSGEVWLWPLPTTFTSYCPSIFRHFL